MSTENGKELDFPPVDLDGRRIMVQDALPALWAWSERKYNYIFELRHLISLFAIRRRTRMASIPSRSTAHECDQEKLA